MSLKKINRITDIPDCGNDSNNLTIAQAHSVDEQKHNDMVSNFFGTTNVAPKTINIPNGSIDHSLDCKIYGIKIMFDINNRTDNSEIDISVDRINTLQKPHDGYMVIYSFHLYKGLLNGLSLKKLEFRKGSYPEDGEESFTILVRGLDAGGNSQYTGDLTVMFP